MTGVRWSRKNPRTLSAELEHRGIQTSPNTVATVMQEQGYSLRVNRKSIAETRHPDRDRQFRYLATVKESFLERGQPVISNDSKKRELVGNFRNQGRAWRKESHQVVPVGGMAEVSGADERAVESAGESRGRQRPLGRSARVQRGSDVFEGSPAVQAFSRGPEACGGKP